MHLPDRLVRRGLHDLDLRLFEQSPAFRALSEHGNGGEQSLGVVLLRVGEQLVHGRLLDDLALVHHHDAVGEVGDHAHVVGDEDDRRVEGVPQFPQEREDLGLHGDVERGRRLVGDDHLRVARDGDGDDDALTQTARELVGVLLEAPFGLGNADHLQQLDGPLVGRLLGDVLVCAQSFADLPTHGVHRVQGRHRLLEDHGDVAAAVLAQLLRRHVAEVDGPEPARSVDLRGLRQEAGHGHRRDGLARSRLTDDRENLARRDVEPDALDRFDDAVLGRERDLQIRNGQHGFRRFRRLRRYCFYAHQKPFVRGIRVSRRCVVVTRREDSADAPVWGRYERTNLKL